MPLFEFVCNHCGEKRELLARSAEAARPSCPGCGRQMAREWSPVAAPGRGAADCAAPRGGFS